MNHDENAIKIEGLSKTYGDFAAVKDLSFAARPGEVFGFLGPNGAGKTTTIRMLMGILVPTAGSATIGGFDCQRERTEVARRTGYVPDNPVFYDYLRGREVVEFVAEMHGFSRREAKERSERMVCEFGLAEAGDDYAVNYSTGMKKRLGLACALVHEPRVLILDEPTNGLDPRASREVQDKIGRLASSGVTVLLSTHLLDMAERICNRVAIIHRGNLAACGAPQELRAHGGEGGNLEDVFLALTEPDLDASA